MVKRDPFTVIDITRTGEEVTAGNRPSGGRREQAAVRTWTSRNEAMEETAMESGTYRRNPLVIKSADIFGVYLLRLDRERLVDRWRVTVKLQDLKDAIETYELEHASR
jgi:hypothetical protein